MFRHPIRAAHAGDAARIAAIYNDGISDRGATFDTVPRSAATIIERIAQSARFPLLVTCDAHDVPRGWAGLSSYRDRPCYAGIAEFSIYLHREARGQRLGAPLLHALIEAARTQGYWKLVSRVFPFNAASRALCRACGFREVGTYEKHAQLDGRWLDVVIVERLIPENQPHSPAATETAPTPGENP